MARAWMRAAVAMSVVGGCVAATGGVTRAAEPLPGAPAAPAAPAPVVCTANLRLPGVMADIVSNVLLRAERQPDERVRVFREKARKLANGDEVVKAAAAEFAIDHDRLAKLVEHFRHVNCRHAPVPGYFPPDSAHAAGPDDLDNPAMRPAWDFARGVVLHVVLHELGHAVIREFDVPVLGNEETMADAFATHALIEFLPENAAATIEARVRSLIFEADEIPREKWSYRGEHDHDARRAYQIAALAVAADADKYAEAGRLVGMSPREIAQAKDYGADIHRAWRRTLAPLRMPEGRNSREVRLRVDDESSAFVESGEPGTGELIRRVLGAIDWHSMVTVEFKWESTGTGGARWNRSTRTVLVDGAYVRRFVLQAQGIAAAPPAELPKTLTPIEPATPRGE